jgi:hypothetical protein
MREQIRIVMALIIIGIAIQYARMVGELWQNVSHTMLIVAGIVLIPFLIGSLQVLYFSTKK